MKKTFGLQTRLLASTLLAGFLVQSVNAMDISHEVRQYTETTGYVEGSITAQIRRIPIIGAYSDVSDPDDPQLDLTLGLSGILEWHPRVAQLFYWCSEGKFKQRHHRVQRMERRK